MISRRNKITLNEILNRINNAILEKENIVFVCNYDLAEGISDYLNNAYDIVDENSQLYQEDLDEYYVSLYFHDYEIEFYCESARGVNENFRVNDCGIVDYYVFLEMTEDEISDSLQGKDGSTIGLYDLVDEEDEDIEYFEDEDLDEDMVEAISDHIAEYVDRIVDNHLCPQCIFNTLVDLYFDAYNAGVRDSKLEMIENLSEDIEELD
jgi:hypothetical protein